MKYKRKSAWTAAVSLMLALLLVGCAATLGVPGASGDDLESNDESESTVSDGDSVDPASLESFTGNTFENSGVTYSLKDFSYAETTEGKFLLQLSLDIKGGSSVEFGGRFMFTVSADPDFREILDSELSMDNDGHYILKAECASVPDQLYLVTPVIALYTESDIEIEDLSALDISYDVDVGPQRSARLCTVSFAPGAIPEIPSQVMLISSGEEYASAGSNIGFTNDSNEFTGGTFKFSVPEGWTVTGDTSVVITETLAFVDPVLWQVDLSAFGQEAASGGTAEPLNVEPTLSDDAQIVVEKQNGYYIIYVLDDLSVEKTGDGQYDISYTVGTGLAAFWGGMDTYLRQDLYLPLLASDENFENLIDIANLDVYKVKYISDEIKLSADDLQGMENEDFRNKLVGSYIESSVWVSSYAGTIETNADVLYISTPILTLTNNTDERVMDESSYAIEYDTFDGSGVVKIVLEFDKPESGSPLIGKPQTVTLVIDGTEYKSNGCGGDGSGDRYVLTYGIELPGDVTLENGYTLIGSGYESLTSPHVFEIDLSAYAG